MFCFLLSLLAFAEDADHSIEVVASRDFEVYVAPIEIMNYTDSIEAIIGDDSVFGYSSLYTRHANIFNGIHYEPITLNTPGFKTYNKDTIKYAYDDCDYIKDAKECANQNDHFLLETHITIDDHQLVVAMFLYDSNLQIVSRSTVTSNKLIRWIRQQEVHIAQQNSAYRSQGASSNCKSASGDCPSPGMANGSTHQNTQVYKPKENLPIKWEIPHKLMDKHIQQASLMVWHGARIK